MKNFLHPSSDINQEMKKHINFQKESEIVPSTLNSNSNNKIDWMFA